jgi:hypothetical protein
MSGKASIADCQDLVRDLAALGIEVPEDVQPGTKNVPADCPACDGDRKMSVTIAKDGQTALWYCHKCGEKGRHSTDGAEHKPLMEPEWLAYWERCQPIEDGTVAAIYLERRGCVLPPARDRATMPLRWDPDAQSWADKRHKGPALIALFVNAGTGEPSTLHATYLAEDGSGKVKDEKKQRRWLAKHEKRGTVCKVFNPFGQMSDQLTLGEGIETTLCGARAGLSPAWACGDAGNLQDFPVLRGRQLTILVDHDHLPKSGENHHGDPLYRDGRRPGVVSAMMLAKRYVAAGVERDHVQLVCPDRVGEDVADLVQANRGKLTPTGLLGERMIDLQAHAAVKEKTYSLPEFVSRFPDQVQFVKVKPTLEELNQQYFMVVQGGQTRIVRHRYPDGDPVWPIEWLKRADFELALANLWIGTGENRKPLAKAWLNSKDRTEHRSVGLYPEGAPPHVYNTWRGFGVEPAEGDWSLMKEHIFRIIGAGNPEYELYILKWIAWKVQNPGKPPEVAVVLRGAKGSGKGVLFGSTGLGGLFTHHGIHSSNYRDVTGTFNAHLADALYIFLDEATWAYDKAAEGILKRLITEPTLRFERKYGPQQEVPNLLAVAMATNSDWAVPASVGERRFAVFDVTNDKAQNHAYFAAIIKQMNEGGRAAMLYDLQQWDLKNWHPRQDIPQTQALQDQIEISEGPVERLVRELLRSGELPNVATSLPANQVYRARLLEQLGEPKLDERSWSTRLGIAMRKIGAQGRQLAPSQGRLWTWVLPPLAEARRRFDPNYQWDGKTAWRSHSTEQQAQALRTIEGKRDEGD